MDLNQTKPKRRTRSKTDKKTLRGRSVWIDETGEITGKKGTKYSEVSTTIPFGTGWITAPTIDESGNKLSDKEVKQRLKDNQGKDFITGEKLPVFSSEEKASEYAQWRSNTMFDKEAIEEGFPEETFPDLPEDKKEKSKEGETSLKGFIDYLMSPSRHFGTGQYNEGGAVMNDQMEMAFMQEGGIIDDDLDVDPVSGNEVPPGSLAEEVRDDIPAQLSEGEYVVPADVVRYYGVKFFEDLRDQAKMGLAEMEANGRIGGEPVPDGGPVNDQELSPQEMQAIQEMMGMAEGGEVQNPYLQQQQLYSQPRPAPIDEKRNTTITNVNPVENQMPMQSMADGGQVQGYQEGNQVTQPDDDIPPFAKNEFNPAQFGLGYSFMGQQPQQTGTTTTQAPQGQTFTVLYHPDYATNGRSKTFYLPRDNEIYQEYLGRGYTKQMPMTGPAGQGETPTTTDTPVTTDLTGSTVTTGSGPEGSNTGTSSITGSMEDKDLDKTTKGLSLLADLSTALAGQLGIPIAALINTQAVAKYNDALTDQSKRKGSIFGGEGSLYDELTDVNKDEKKNFGDTWLGDLLGFDKKAGVQGPNLKDSFMGARRGFDTAQLESTAPIGSTANNLVEPENRLKNQRGFTPKSTAPKTQAQKDAAAKDSINDWVSATNATKGKKGIERHKAIKAQSEASKKATKAIREASGYNKKNEGGLMNKKGKK